LSREIVPGTIETNGFSSVESRAQDTPFLAASQDEVANHKVTFDSQVRSAVISGNLVTHRSTENTKSYGLEARAQNRFAMCSEVNNLKQPHSMSAADFTS